MTGDQKKKSKAEKQKRGELVRYLGMASTVGINMVVSTFVGFALGYWVFDRYLNTQPWFTIVMTSLGIFAGFKYLFKVAKKMEERDNE